MTTKPTAEDRFWPKVDRRGPDDCWPWLASIHPDGYGRFGVNRKIVPAHRFSWELANGRPVPEGRVIDHLCRNRACVNPAHLDPVTNHVNVVIRGFAPASLHLRKTHCIHGHEFTPENTRVRKTPWGTGRQCRECDRLHEAARKRGAR